VTLRALQVAQIFYGTIATVAAPDLSLSVLARRERFKQMYSKALA
jgi:hypothetical protein